MGLIDRIQVWLYDVSKTVITIILLIIIALFFLRFGWPSMSATAGEAVPTQVAQAKPTPAPTIGAPTFDVPGRGFQIGQNELRGTAPGADKVQVVIGGAGGAGEVIGTVDVNPDGTWSLPFVLAQPGTYDLEVHTLDSQGVVASKRIGTLRVTEKLAQLDVRAPSWGEWKPVDASRSKASLELVGQGDPGAIVLVRADEDKLGEIKVGADGSWSLVEDVTQTHGPHVLVLEMIDTVGKPLGALDPIPFTVPEPAPAPTATPQPTPAPTATPEPTPEPEPQVPAPAITFPENGAVVRAGAAGIRGTGAPGAEIEVLDNDVVAGSTAVTDDGAWRFDYEIGEGDHRLIARVIVAPGAASDPIRLLAIPGEIECDLVAPPDESRCPPNPPAGQDLGATYIVAECETLGLIAKRTGVTVSDILTINPEICNPNLIFTGQVLSMPPRD